MNFIDQLTRRPWTFKRSDGQILCKNIQLMPNGTIKNYKNKNENSWRINNDFVEFLDAEEEVTTRFSQCHTNKDELLILEGSFLLAPDAKVVHSLEQKRDTLTVNTIESPRKNLIIARVGNNSLHEGWIDGSERTWDLALSCYGDAVRTGAAEYMSYQVGPKWGPLYDFIRANSKLVFSYGFICLSDDDLESETKNWNGLFETCEMLNLLLAQPALTKDSSVSHELTYKDDRYSLRFTNFVEVMCPIFSNNSLKICLSTMGQRSKYGWGQDYIWPTLLEASPLQIAIIDEFPVKHSRPVGHNTDFQDADDKMRELISEYGLEMPSLTVYGGLFDKLPERY